MSADTKEPIIGPQAFFVTFIDVFFVVNPGLEIFRSTSSWTHGCFETVQLTTCPIIPKDVYLVPGPMVRTYSLYQETNSKLRMFNIYIYILYITYIYIYILNIYIYIYYVYIYIFIYCIYIYIYNVYVYINISDYIKCMCLSLYT